MFLPERIRSLIADEPYQTDEIGMSGSSVLIFEDKVLKIQPYNEEAANEYRMLEYLQGRVPVPAVHACEAAEGRFYLLMSRCAGQMACSDGYMRQPEAVCRLLAHGLQTLWSIDAADCPSDQSLSRKLARAAFNVENHLVDLDNVEPDTFGEGGFRDPEDLLQWLYDNRPEEEPVLSHGDFCLPNLFGVHDQITGYIDLGRAGIADKWCDIALSYRSLSDNCAGRYSDRQKDRFCNGFDPCLLFHELGMEPDWEKIRYYILLDELF